jgi:hypothetical protein
MEKCIVFILISILVIFVPSCTDEVGNIESKGLTLWWNHQIFNEEEGRGYIFEFYEVERSENLYQLKFKHQIDRKGKIIDIRLMDKIDHGKCPDYPGDWDDLCVAKGGFYIPENSIDEGTYKFNVRTANYSAQSEIIINREKAMLNIPENNYFSSNIKEVFITPRNLLYGSIAFSGEQNKEYALDFIEDLKSSGLRDTIVSNLPFNLMEYNVDEEGNPVIHFWEPDNYSLPFLFSLTVDFSSVFDLAKEHFNKSSIDIYLFSSNGDQARLSKIDGVYVAYAKEE